MQREQFVRAICANPSDISLRLVYTDWLEENGEQDLAELIRLHIRHAAGGYTENRALSALLRLFSMRTLCLDLATPWTGQGLGVKIYSSDGCHRCKLVASYREIGEVYFSGGFISRVIFETCWDFLKHARELFSFHPVTAVQVAGKWPAAAYHEPEHLWLYQPYRSSDRTANFLPKKLFHCLARAYPVRTYWGPSGSNGVSSVKFASADEAIIALQRTCVFYGRGLQKPPLPPIIFLTDTQ